MLTSRDWKVQQVLNATMLVFLLAWPSPGLAQAGREFPHPTGYVNDFAGVLDPQAREQLEHLLTRIDGELEVQFTVVTMNDLGGEDPTDYANRLYENWGVGNKKTHRGVMILDVIGQRFLKIEVGYGLEGVLNDARTGDVRRQVMTPLLQQGRRDLAYAAGVRALALPILDEMGRSPALLDSLVRDEGYNLGRRNARGRGLPLPILMVILLVILSSLRRRTRGWMLGGMMGGGFGGFGGFGGGGGGGGGFGGFGGGSSGGGGSGGSY